MILSSDAIRYALMKESQVGYSPRSAAASIVLRAMSGNADGQTFMKRIEIMTKSVTPEIVAEVEVLRAKYHL